MKKSFPAVVVLLLVVAMATSTSAQNAFNRKDMILSAGLGLGMYGVYGSATLPPLFVAFETGIGGTGVAEKITVGGIVAFSGSSQDYPFGKYKYSYIVISGRGAYHFLENNKDFDAYAGLGLGYGIVSSSAETKVPGASTLGFASAGASYFFFDIFAGGRYYFSPKWAALAEVGYGVGFLRVGVSYKIN